MNDTVTRQRTSVSVGAVQTFTDLPPTLRRGGGRSSPTRDAIRNLGPGESVALNISHDLGHERAINNIRSSINSLQKELGYPLKVRRESITNDNACIVRVYRMPPEVSTETPTNA